MKKILCFLAFLLCLTACSNSSKIESDQDTRYISLVESLLDYSKYETSSNYYDITTEMAKIDDGYRFYVTIDNPRVALYDVEAIALEEDVDYTATMAANVGVFEESEYSLIPNQTNPDKGYVKGIVISGVSENSDINLYVYVSFKNEDHSITRSEYFKFNVKYEDQ